MLRIVPYTPEHVLAVKAMNERLRRGGMHVHQASETADVGPALHGRYNSRWAEQFVAVDATESVRGVYTLIHSRFQVAEEILDVPFLQLPLSEGAVDSKFSLVGVFLLKDVLRRAPVSYGLGMGGFELPLPRLYKKLGAEVREVPFFFRLCRAGPFLRHSPMLRQSASRRLAADLAAATYAGAVGLSLLNGWWSRNVPRTQPDAVQVVDSFDGWADELWFAARGQYSFVSLRDSETLNHLYTRTAAPVIRLRIRSGDKAIGWAVVIAARLHAGHKYFPNMKLGSIVDCLALGGAEGTVIAAAMRFLERQSVDLIVSNQMNATWKAALAAAGFRQYRSNMLFAAPAPLWKLLQAADPNLTRAHINRGDGDGPYNLY